VLNKTNEARLTSAIKLDLTLIPKAAFSPIPIPLISSKKSAAVGVRSAQDSKWHESFAAYRCLGQRDEASIAVDCMVVWQSSNTDRLPPSLKGQAHVFYFMGFWLD